MSTMFYACFSLLLVVSFCTWVGIRYMGSDDGIRSYALGSRGYGFFALFATLLASDAGAYLLVSKPEKSFTHGFSPLVRSIASIGFIITAVIVMPNIRRIPNAMSIGDIGAFAYGNIARILFGLNWLIFGMIVIITEFNFLQKLAETLVGDKASIIAMVGLFSVILYCYMGGIRAVIKTDMLQSMFVIIIIPAMLYFVISNLGGFTKIWPTFVNKSYELGTGDWNKGSVIRYAIYSPLNTLFLPIVIQRLYMARDAKTAYSAMVWRIVIFAFLSFLACCLGILLSIQTNGNLEGKHLLTVMFDNFNHPYTRMFFMTGIFAAIFAALDSYMNSVSITLVRDIIQPLVLFLNKAGAGKITEKNGLKWAKNSVLIMGILAFIIANYITSVFDLLIKFNVFWPTAVGIPVAGIFLGKVLTQRLFYFYTITASLFVIFTMFVLPLYCNIAMLDRVFYSGMFALATYLLLYQLYGIDVKKQKESTDEALLEKNSA